VRRGNNAGAGFLCPLRFFASFVTDVDPGISLPFSLPRTIATKRPDVASAIVGYSRNEYVEVAEALTRPLLVDSPLTVAETVALWARESEGIKSLMAEHQTFEYGPENLPVRVLFSHFLAFNIDRLARPEFFCWPGAWMVGERLSPGNYDALRTSLGFVRGQSRRWRHLSAYRIWEERRDCPQGIRVLLRV